MTSAEHFGCPCPVEKAPHRQEKLCCLLRSRPRLPRTHCCSVHAVARVAPRPCVCTRPASSRCVAAKPLSRFSFSLQVKRVQEPSPPPAFRLEGVNSKRIPKPRENRKNGVHTSHDGVLACSSGLFAHIALPLTSKTVLTHGLSTQNRVWGR